MAAASALHLARARAFSERGIACLRIAEPPFGGVKNSDSGRELSSAGIQEFVNKKLIRAS